MSDPQIIEAKVRAATGRRRIQSGWRGMWIGLLAGCLLWLIVLAVYKLAPIHMEALAVGGIAALLAPLAGLTVGLARRITPAETARWLDQRQGLKERLGTALELDADAGRKNGDPWARLVLQDAAQAAANLNPRRLMPFRLPRACHWIVLALAVAVGVGFMPEYRSKEYLQEQMDAAVIRDAGRNVAALTKHQLKTKPPEFDRTRESLESVQELGERLAKVRLIRAEAMSELASAAEKLRDQVRRLNSDHTLDKMRRAARTPGGSGNPSKADLERKISNLQKALGKAADQSPEELDKLKSELDAIQQAATGLPEANTPEGRAARQKLAQSLANLSQMAQKMGLEMPNLDEAIEALQSSDIDQFLENLDFAMDDLEQMAAMAKALQKLQMQMAQIGKDLAEQLDKGQAHIAIDTLEKMIQKLQSADLSQEEMQQMIGEVSKAIDPGSQYGQVGEFLKQAAKQMKNGQSQQAAQSLAEAAEELKRLMEQMGDCEGLMAALKNLQRAQMAIGNCQGFGQCRSPYAGWKPGGKPNARGVGTWADESLMMDLKELQQLWDNSGITRPDLDARGITDRGEGKVPDNMDPTRVKGKFSPGGPMPSITLRGVSIKGTSRVQFEEAATAAQSEAQNALNQDKVPRAYRGAVRDYFDDLKE